MKNIIYLFAILIAFASCKKDDPIPETLIVEGTVSNATLYGANDGSIELEVKGGTQPYAFEWSNGSTEQSQDSLLAGSYQVTVSDAGDQTQIDTFEVSQPADIVLPTDTVVINTQPSYIKDVYYSLKNGIVKESDRIAWDLAFSTGPMTSSIYINDGNDVKLYYWGDTSVYETIDISDIDSREPIYNNYDAETWQDGAFDQNATGHPNYGWGVYNSTTHNVEGNSSYVIVFSDGTSKKLIIKKREASNNSFHLKYANIDGSDEQMPIIACGDYLSNNLIHFSIQNNTIIDHEPESNSWDLMFTKYSFPTPDGSGGYQPYGVTGVLCNENIEVSKNAETDVESDDYMDAEYVKNISAIGSDWKSFNMGTLSYDLEENLLYYVKDANENYYKIVFTGFEGRGTGIYKFVKTSY